MIGVHFDTRKIGYKYSLPYVKYVNDLTLQFFPRAIQSTRLLQTCLKLLQYLNVIQDKRRVTTHN